MALIRDRVELARRGNNPNVICRLFSEAAYGALKLRLKDAIKQRRANA